MQIDVDVQDLKVRYSVLDRRVKERQEWYHKMVEEGRTRIEKNDAWEEFVVAAAKRSEFLELIRMMGLWTAVMVNEKGDVSCSPTDITT